MQCNTNKGNPRKPKQPPSLLLMACPVPHMASSQMDSAQRQKDISKQFCSNSSPGRTPPLANQEALTYWPRATTSAPLIHFHYISGTSRWVYKHWWQKRCKRDFPSVTIFVFSSQRQRVLRTFFTCPEANWLSLSLHDIPRISRT